MLWLYSSLVCGVLGLLFRLAVLCFVLCIRCNNVFIIFTVLLWYYFLLLCIV